MVIQGSSVEMKKLFCSLFLLLEVSVSGVVLKVDVYETGTENNVVVIQCPYDGYYKTYPKYFCTGVYKNCSTLIKTDGKEEWVFKGRLNVNDNKEKNVFVVTFTNLSSGDTGHYGCGIQRIGQDVFTLIHLTVTKETSSLTVTSKPGCITDSSGSFTKPTASPSLAGSDVLMYAGGGFGAVLLVFLITLCVYKCRGMKDCGGTTFPKTPDMKEVYVYEEIHLSSPAEERQTPDLTSCAYRDCRTVYSTITNHMQDPHHNLSLPSAPLSRGPNVHRDKTKDLQEPKYSHLEFPDAGDFYPSMKDNDIYCTGGEAVNNENTIYSTIVPKSDEAETPRRETSI